MKKYSPQDRAEMVELHFKRDENATSAARAWSGKSHHKNQRKPDKNTSKSTAENFRRTGSVHDHVEAMKTKPRSARTPDIIEKARASVSSDPGISTRNLARDLDTALLGSFFPFLLLIQRLPPPIETSLMSARFR